MPEDKSKFESAHKVLIVEDTVELAEILRATLERMQLKVFHETHGTKALAVFSAENPDLVLLDIALPDTTGWKVLETIREQRQDSRSPAIIVITAYGDPANRLMGKLQGVHSYLIKPFMPDEVERAVSKALGLGKK
jgi:DNA-binding response OmpR family regulator